MTRLLFLFFLSFSYLLAECPSRTQFQGNITDGLRAVPAVAADISTKDVLLYQLTIVNPTAGAITITIVDKQSSAKTLLGAVSIAANTTYVVAFPCGVKLKSGMNWVASGAGLHAEIYGFYKP